MTLAGCGEQAGGGLLPFEEYEKVDVEVWFHFEGDRQGQYLGLTKGSSSCGSVARRHAQTQSVTDTRWSYICVTPDGKHKIR